MQEFQANFFFTLSFWDIVCGVLGWKMKLSHFGIRHSMWSPVNFSNALHTLTRHFITCILLLPGWTTFWFYTYLKSHGIARCWKHSSETSQIRQLFQSFINQFWWACANSSLSFLFSDDKVWYSPALLQI